LLSSGENSGENAPPTCTTVCVDAMATAVTEDDSASSRPPDSDASPEVIAVRLVHEEDGGAGAAIKRVPLSHDAGGTPRRPDPQLPNVSSASPAQRACVTSRVQRKCTHITITAEAYLSQRRGCHGLGRRKTRQTAGLAPGTRLRGAQAAPQSGPRSPQSSTVKKTTTADPLHRHTHARPRTELASTAVTTQHQRQWAERTLPHHGIRRPDDAADHRRAVP
jgi:hypothetical protein